MSGLKLRSLSRKRREESRGGSASTDVSNNDNHIIFYQVLGEFDEVPTVQDVFCLFYFQSSMFATILEDVLTELRILAECNNSLRLCKTMTDMGIHLAKKFKIAQPAIKDELDGIDPKNLKCDSYKLDKLDKDRNSIIDVLTNLYLDLAVIKSWKSLDGNNKQVLGLNQARLELAEEETKNRLIRRELAKQRRQQRNHIKSATYDTDLVIEGLKTQVEDAILNAECHKRYIDNWQRSRTEQNTQLIVDKESVATGSIELYKEKIDNEQRIHNEVEVLINISINETLQKVESWMNKYDKDIEAIDLKIQIRKNEHQNAYDKRLELEETLEEHDKLMKDWVHFKDEREKARLYREKMHNSAITVQAWWRGLLVRLEMGPYKVVKKPGKPAGKQAGKKK